MEFTTHFGLQSQTTRLFGHRSYPRQRPRVRGSHPLRLAFPGRLWGRCLGRNWPYRLQFAGASTGDFKFELFPLRSPLLGESLLVSFPPLINMLKFSG